MRTALAILVSAGLGAIIACVGAVAHRSVPPFGVILSVLLVMVAVVFVRAWVGWLGVIALAVPFILLTTLFSRPGPAESLLIAGDPLGYAWLYGSAGAVVITCILPARLLGGGPSVTSA